MNLQDFEEQLKECAAHKERLLSEGYALLAKEREEYQAREQQILQCIELIKGPSDVGEVKPKRANKKVEASKKTAVYLTKEMIEGKVAELVRDNVPLTEEELWGLTRDHFRTSHSLSGARRIFRTVIGKYATAEAADSRLGNVK